MTPQERTAGGACVAQERERDVMAALGTGLSIREIARQTGASYGYVRRRAIMMGRQGTRGHANKPDHVWKNSPIGWPKRKGP